MSMSCKTFSSVSWQRSGCEHNGLQKIRIQNRTPMAATVGTSCQENQLNVF